MSKLGFLPFPMQFVEIIKNLSIFFNPSTEKRNIISVKKRQKLVNVVFGAPLTRSLNVSKYIHIWCISQKYQNVNSRVYTVECGVGELFEWRFVLEISLSET